MRKWKELTKEEKKELIIKGVIFAAGVGLGIGGSYAVRKGHDRYIQKKYPGSNMSLMKNEATGRYYVVGILEDAAHTREHMTDWTFAAKDGSLEGLRDLFAESVEHISKEIAKRDSAKFNEALADAVEAIGDKK